MQIVKNVRIPMRDGVRLAADLHAPDDWGLEGGRPLPVVMDYIPYRKDDAGPGHRYYEELPEHGYVVARVDVRGTGASEGVTTDEYVLQEQVDGYDTVEWIAAQPWCDGHVNMMGISYGGFTALQVAAQAPPHLTSIIPVDFTDDRYTDDCHYRGGLLRKYFDAGTYGTWMVAFNAMPPAPEDLGGDWARLWEEHVERSEPYQLNWLRNQTDGPYWRNGSVADVVDRIACPVFMIGGWRDGYPNPPLRLYAALDVPRKVLIGPWNHSYPDTAVPGPRIDHLREVVRWLDHWCRGRDTGIMEEPPVVFFVQESQTPDADRLEAEGEWRAEVAWPIPGASERTLYLGAAGALGDEAGDDGEDVLEYVPSVGVTGGLFSAALQFGLPGDQRPDEAFSLVYTTPPLDEDVRIAGRARVRLHVASSASVIGFVASLADVGPDGASHLVAKGALNATRRTSLTDPEPLVPGEVVELELEIDTTAWRFAAGHSIRVAIANADWPNVWPTPKAATSRVHRGGTRPSCVVLPVVPRDGSATPPEFAPSPVAMARHSDAVQPPVWEVTRDVLTGQTRVHIEGTRGEERVDERTVVSRSLLCDCVVDDADPARASVRGRHVNRISRPAQEVVGTAEVVVESTRAHFHITTLLDVRVDGVPHTSRRWVESIPRNLL